MEFQVLHELLKVIPEGLSAIVLIIFILYTLYSKNKESTLTEVTEVGKLQSSQLTTLIDQNVKLAEELHSVRTELTTAYDMISDMRDKITELEDMLKLVQNKEIKGVKND